MRVLKRVTARLGHETSGSDEASGGHAAENVDGASVVVRSSAISDDNVEVERAKSLGIPVVGRAEYLAATAASFGRVIAIAGSHGKTTATALCYEATRSLNPTLHLGGERVSGGDEGGGDEYFITEACEYERAFSYMCADVGVILNSDLDHTDCYKSRGEIAAAFKAFGAACGTLYVCGDDAELSGLKEIGATTFGFGEDCDVRAVGLCENERGEYSFSIIYRGVAIGRVSLSLTGRHNAYNALAAACVALGEGVSASEIARAFANFKGVKRRDETLGRVRGARIIADYAHHPTEIRALLATYGKFGPIVAFEPHTYSRTKDLFDEFVGCFDGAEEVVALPIFAARERGGSVRSEDLVAALEGRVKARYCGSYAEANEYILSRLDVGKVALYVGAGGIYQAAKSLVREHGES